jgi:two-component system, NarL family, response regulator LiaR
MLSSSSVMGSTLNLSAREMQVLRLLVEGYSNPEIATSLCISISTVKTHVRNIMNKFGVNHRIQAVVLAVRSGLVN